MPQDVLGHLRDRLEDRKWHILADDRGRLEEALLFGREPVDPSGQDRLDRRRDLNARERVGEAIGAALPGQHLRLDQRADALLQEERVPLGALDQEVLERPKGGVRAQERVQQGLGALGRQGVEPELRVVGLAAPAMRVLGAVVHEEEHPGRRQALDQTVQDGLGLAVDPVEVLEDDEQRLDLALAQEQTLDRLQGPLAALRRVERRPRGVVHRHVQQRQERGHGGLEGLVQRQELAGDLLADGPRIVLVLNLQVSLEQVDHGQIRRGLPVGDRAGLHDEPAVGPMGVGDLPHQPRLAHAGLPDEGHELAMPRGGAAERLAELLDLGLPPDEAGEPARGGGLEPRTQRARPEHLVDLDGRLQALHRHRPEGLDVDEALGEPQRVRGQEAWCRRWRAAPCGPRGAWSVPRPCSPCGGRCRWPARRPPRSSARRESPCLIPKVRRTSSA